MNGCRQCGWPWGVDPITRLCVSCTKLKAKPDKLSKVTNLGGIPFKDLHVWEVHAGRHDVIANLPWLMGLAFDSLEDKRPTFAAIDY